MPAYHQYCGYRLDLTKIEDVSLRLDIRDKVRKISGESYLTDTVLREELSELASRNSGYVFELLVYIPDYFTLELWTLSDSKIDVNYLKWQGEITGNILDDLFEDNPLISLNEAELDLWEKVVERLGGEPEYNMFPRFWDTISAVREAVDYLDPRIDEPVESIITVGDDTVYIQAGGGKANVERLIPLSQDPKQQEIVNVLYRGEQIELGCAQLARGRRNPPNPL